MGGVNLRLDSILDGGHHSDDHTREERRQNRHSEYHPNLDMLGTMMETGFRRPQVDGDVT